MVNDLEQAEVEVIKLVQADAFEKETKALKELHSHFKCESRKSDKEKKVAMKKTSSLHILDPFLDCNGVLRVGGRIKKANLSESLKNPRSTSADLFTALNVLHFKVSYRQWSFTRPIHREVQRKRKALKLRERLKLQTVLFSRVFDLQNRICYRQLHL